MTEQPDERMVTDDGAVVHQPFGGYKIETEPLPDGRRIHYYSWTEATAEPDAGPDADPDGDR